MSDLITSAIIIPSYNETLALPALLRDLKHGLSRNDVVIVMDDSSDEIARVVRRECLAAIEGAEFEYKYISSGYKSGRGAAVRRGMSIALSSYPKIDKILECDADGSHQASDILKIKDSCSKSDLLVGSRYLPTSEIIGWPLSRRIFSWILNKSIPRLTGIRIRDITNGLRRYSKPAAELILGEPQVNTGFVYLSEQALLLVNGQMTISEEPIVFVDRTLGQSTVTWREISKSLNGIVKLILKSHRK